MAKLSNSLSPVMNALRKSGLMKSLCSVLAPDGNLTASGATSNTYVPVAGLQNIKCMNAPYNFSITSTISATEQRTITDVESRSMRHVLLDNYYPQFTVGTNWGNVRCRATVDGTTDDIRGAEADSQQIMTRLFLEAVKM